MVEGMDLPERVLDELLPAKAGVHRHEEHHVDIVDQLLERVDGGAGIQGNARTTARRLDLLDDAVRVTRRLDMKGDDVRPRARKTLNVCLWVLDHQMHVKDRLGHLAQTLDHTCTHRDIRHKRPVHHIDVDVLCSRFLDAAHLCPEIRKIRREDGRRNNRWTLNVDMLLFLHHLFFVFVFMCHGSVSYFLADRISLSSAM